MEYLRIYALLSTLFSLSVSLMGQDTQTSTSTPENMPVTLPCESQGENYLFKEWLRGFKNSLVMEEKALFRLSSGSPATKKTSRSDITLNDTSFSLTIGEPQLEDNSVFTCHVFTRDRSIYNYVNLTVYTTSDIQISLFPEGEVRENTSVMVKCSLPRVYPELSKQSMVMKIKNEPFYPGVGERNMHPDNSSYKYEIIETIMATKDYNEEEILCEVKPTLGDIKRKSRTLRVLYQPEGKPKIITETNPYLGAEVKLTCDTMQVDGYPENYNYTWFRNGSELETGTHNIISFTASRESDGNYSCQVTNSQGSSSRSNITSIIVKDKEEPNHAAAVVLPAAVGGAVGFVLVLILIVAVVVCCHKRKAKKSEKQDGSSTTKLTRNGNLETVVDPPASAGAAEYWDIPSPRQKPVPAKRSFKKPKAGAGYSEAHPEYRGIAGPASQHHADHIYEEANYAGKRPDPANNNDDTPKLVYAQLDLISPKKKKPGMNNQAPPTEYADIDFKRTGKFV